MKVVTSISPLRSALTVARSEGQTIGLVPTMGALHEGHLTLMRTAKQACDFVVASIFVNPIQFGQGEDYAIYPRDLERDSQLAAKEGVDIIFAPAVEEMYPDGYEQLKTFVEVEDLTTKLCGASRPGHFRGVTTVVSKLFHIVQPKMAFFGQKDAQQVAVIKRMVRDLNMNIQIVPVPIVRETDGLAMSSRNAFLSPVERKAALVLSQSLQLARKLLLAGQREVDAIRGAMVDLIEQQPLATIDYVAIVDADQLTELQTIDRPILIALAVKIGKTRLIDNMLWEG